MPLFNPLTVEVQEEGTPEGAVNSLNFTGDVDVTVTDSVAEINITGGGTPPLLPTTGTGTATGAVVGSLDGNTLNIQQGANPFLTIDPTANAEVSLLRAHNSTGLGNVSKLEAQTSDENAIFTIEASFNDGDAMSIVGTVNGSSRDIAHTADTHTFNNGANENGKITDGESFIRSFNDTDDNNVGLFYAATTDTDAGAQIRADFNDGVKRAEILAYADASASSITHTADNHIFNGPLQLNGSTSGDVDIQSDALGNAPNGTTLSGTGYIGATMFSRLTGNHTMSDVNTVQPVFSSGQDVWTLQGATTYRFKGQYYFTHGAVSHSVGMSFELGGGASVTAISYTSSCWVTAAGTTTTTQTSTLVNVATNVNVNFAGANAQETIIFEGWITMNAGGTVTPSITFSAAPGGAPAAVAYATWIEFTPIATNTATSLGNVA